MLRQPAGEIGGRRSGDERDGRSESRGVRPVWWGKEKVERRVR